MLGHQHVLRDVDQQLLLVELLNVVLAALSLQQALPRERREVRLHHDDGARHVVVLHPLRVILRPREQAAQASAHERTQPPRRAARALIFFTPTFSSSGKKT